MKTIQEIQERIDRLKSDSAKLEKMWLEEIDTEGIREQIQFNQVDINALEWVLAK